MLLRDFFAEVYVPVRLRGRSKRTVTLYDRSIVAYGQFLGREATLDDLEDLSVSRYLRSLEPRLAPHSIAKERSQLLAIWNCAARRRYVQAFPDVPTAPLPVRVPVAWTEPELRQLLAACRREPGELAGIRAADWWTALHLVMWDTAERIAALLQVRWEDLSPPWLRIRAETRKGRRADQMHRLASETLETLERIRQPARELVFPWPYSEPYLWRAYGLILSSAHLPRDRQRKFHCLRKSVASHLKARGVDPQAVLGHADPRTTQAYLDPRIVGGPVPCDVLPRICE